MIFLFVKCRYQVPVVAIYWAQGIYHGIVMKLNSVDSYCTKKSIANEPIAIGSM
jgi:hypothetical protein